jgi:bacterioferritin
MSTEQPGKPAGAQTAGGRSFLTDIETLRRRARESIEDGAVTDSNKGISEELCKILNGALATELVCVLRYRQHHFAAQSVFAQSIAAEFLVHANEEQGHADRIAERIVQLGGNPEMGPKALAANSHTDYVECDNLYEMVRENLVAERIAIESYREIAQYIGDRDPTTRRMIEAILAVEEEHADELSDFLVDLPKTAGEHT